MKIGIVVIVIVTRFRAIIYITYFMKTKDSPGFQRLSEFMKLTVAVSVKSNQAD
jgi:hypothetical protein